MAGDWIKVEKVSAHKPEVLKIARMLGVSRQHAFGLLVEFWAWLDSNCVDGVVDGVVDADVDALMSCDGLSALLVLVKWVEFDADPARMRVLNFDRHNGESSKNRALKSERQAKWRAKSVDGPVDATPSTREEKRREEKKEQKQEQPATKARKRATTLPDGFAISERVKTWAAEKGYTRLDQHLEAFLGKCRAKGYTYIDWDEALMNCIREDWGKVNAAKVAQLPERHGSHVPAKLPVFGPKTEMPQDMRGVFAKLKLGA